VRKTRLEIKKLRQELARSSMTDIKLALEIDSLKQQAARSNLTDEKLQLELEKLVEDRIRQQREDIRADQRILSADLLDMQKTLKSIRHLQGGGGETHRVYRMGVKVWVAMIFLAVIAFAIYRQEQHVTLGFTLSLLMSWLILAHAVLKDVVRTQRHPHAR
jgi:hypothetical protein